MMFSSQNLVIINFNFKPMEVGNLGEVIEDMEAISLIDDARTAAIRIAK